MLSWLGLPFRAVATEIDESPLPGETPAAMVLRLAQAKARAVTPTRPDEWILAADTTVELDNVALGKPIAPKEAFTMLLQLRNRDHNVHTAIALRDPQTARETLQLTTTRVWMRHYTEAEINAYIASGDPLDKAGSYAIQSTQFHPVARLEGCYSNVVGLPLCTLITLLQNWGYSPQVNLAALCRDHFGQDCSCPPAIEFHP